MADYRHSNKERKVTMALPTYQDVMLPLLKACAGREIRLMEAVEVLAREFHLSDAERDERHPSGRQAIFANRIAWAKTYLSKAGLLTSLRRGVFGLTDEGRRVLATNPRRVDNGTLMQFPAFRAFRARGHSGEGDSDPVSLQIGAQAALTPDEMLRSAHAEMEAALAADLLLRIRSGPPAFFERVIVQLLIAMGYGGVTADIDRALVGQSGDNGIDGVIDQDPLGLDRIYVQAKRYAEDNPVGAGAIRDFFGSLDRVKASKGVFVTTSRFSLSARETAEHLSKRLVLIDGEKLANLMIKHNVGCRIQETFYSKTVDEEFFE